MKKLSDADVTWPKAVKLVRDGDEALMKKLTEAKLKEWFKAVQDGSMPRMKNKIYFPVENDDGLRIAVFHCGEDDEPKIAVLLDEKDIRQRLSSSSIFWESSTKGL